MEVLWKTNKRQIKMKVSIITTCYNRATTIREAIESVLDQDYSLIEFIIVDGASSDGSFEVIKNEERKLTSEEFAVKYPHFSFIFVSEPDKGMYEAINKGLRMATGDIVGLVHSDDMLYNEHVISEIVGTFEKSGADFVYGNGVFVDAENTKRPSGYGKVALFTDGK